MSSDDPTKSLEELDNATYYEEGNVGVYELIDISELFDSDGVETVEKHYTEYGKDPSITGTAVLLGNASGLGFRMSELLDRVSDKWSSNADKVNVKRLAYAADGATSYAVKSKIEADIQLESFNELEEAIEWCQEV